MEQQAEVGPVQQLQRAAQDVACELAGRWQHACDSSSGMQRLALQLWQQSPLGQMHQRHVSSSGTQIQGMWRPVLASVSLALSGVRPRAQPLYEVAMAKDEVKARLAPVPVYTVANPKNEFVLVAGENNSQIGFFFFRREDAEAIVEKIREENPRLARDSKILRVTMDNVYEVFTTPREQTGLQGIHFKFFPDMLQVTHALQLYKDAGVPTRQFVGVPVFQAEGLTVTTQEMQYVPLFLCKEDLDIAVQSAYAQRNAAQIKVYRDKADKYEEEYDQVVQQAANASGREKSQLESRANKAKQKLDTAREKSDSVAQAPLPKIEVGSFEEVIQRMNLSEGPELAAWSQVMFVAPNLLQQAVLKDEAAAKAQAAAKKQLALTGGAKK